MGNASITTHQSLSVSLPDVASAITLPHGWSIASGAPALTLIGPERDLQIAFVAMADTRDKQAMVAAAWHLLDPSFDLPIAQQSEAPATHGWDACTQILYRPPSAESRVAFATVRTLGARVYVNLVTGTLAGFARREAQIEELRDAWRPDGLVATSLADRTAVGWGAAQSEALDAFIRDAMHTLQVPGLSIAIVQAGEVAYAEGFGVCSIDGKQAVATDTRFMIGSTTKSLTTLLMARLIEQDHFSWSTPLTKILPDFTLADAEMTQQLQMRHTVAACTGMPRRDIDLMFKFNDVTAEQRLSEMSKMTPTTGFDEVFQYSNYLVAAGGYAAARSFARDGSLDSSYALAMQQWVFDPLQMSNTTLHKTQGCTNCAAPHAIDFDGHSALIDPNMEKFADAVAPAGAIWSTALDMARYLRLELNGGFAPNGTVLLATDALQQRWRGGIKIDGNTSYGLGLICADEQGLEVIGHGGGTSGFSSDMYFLPAKQIGVVVLSNLRGAHVFLAALRQKIIEILFDAKPTSAQMIAAAMKAMQDATTSVRSRVTIDYDSLRWLNNLLGRYHCAELGNVEISQREAGYWAAFDGWGSSLGSEIQSGESRFVVLTSPPWIGLRLRVNADHSELHLDGGQTKYVFKKCQSAN
ncbi:class A beta-lactamase-related serine hydrolase [Pseudolysobacter antarcticus]|uniref:Class A beta-lactamase-related serine hydrolase n=1 Tax=Pseudolysobacter antarcticus TaxID=2511995 RepID=A0A411HFS6_9GAMM|nr:serine hydrolase domain-containing protein [Pseudolysobacter antarcticus]QBB69317.1 class A beta-lactamase-related serine hydrolase [Pseudolysobacter antarcticus]